MDEVATARIAAIRNEPVQARSAARLTALLDAAAAVIAEGGYERLTTAMVAERANASIGTVYRYFPDRIAVLQAVAARNFERVVERVRIEASSDANTDWSSALEAIVDALASAFRDEVGYRSLRVGDVIDLRPRLEGSTANARLAELVLEILGSRFGAPDGDRTALAVEGAIEAADALLARAFAFDDHGDERFIDLARETVRSLAAPAFSSR